MSTMCLAGAGIAEHPPLHAAPPARRPPDMRAEEAAPTASATAPTAGSRAPRSLMYESLGRMSAKSACGTQRGQGARKGLAAGKGWPCKGAPAVLSSVCTPLGGALLLTARAVNCKAAHPRSPAKRVSRRVRRSFVSVSRASRTPSASRSSASASAPGQRPAMGTSGPSRAAAAALGGAAPVPCSKARLIEKLGNLYSLISRSTTWRAGPGVREPQKTGGSRAKQHQGRPAACG